MGGALLLLHVGKTKNGYKLTVDPRYGPATILKGIHIIELAYGQYPLKLAMLEQRRLGQSEASWFAPFTANVQKFLSGGTTGPATC
jgi:hypothetical protein